MGIRGELFSTKFTCDGRTYFFNVKQNRTGDVFLSIVESKPSEGETFDRRSIVVFGEHMDGFLKSFQAALKFMDKTGNKVAPDLSLYARDDDDAEDNYPRQSRDERPRDGRSRGSFADRSNDRSRQGSAERTNQGRSEFHRRSDRSERSDRQERGDRSSTSDRFNRYQENRYRGDSYPSGQSGQRRNGKPVVHVGSKEKRNEGRKTDSTDRSLSGQTKPIKRIVVKRAKKSDTPKDQD